MHCKHCGQPLLEHAEYCMYCGRRVEVQPLPPPPPPPLSPRPPVSPYAPGHIYRPYSALAVTSFVCGLCLCLPCLAPAAIVLGMVALYQIQAHPRELKGRGFAVTGVMLGILSLLLWGWLAHVAQQSPLRWQPGGRGIEIHRPAPTVEPEEPVQPDEPEETPWLVPDEGETDQV